MSFIGTTVFFSLIISLGIVFVIREVFTYLGKKPLKYIFTPIITFFIIVICLFSFGNGEMNRFKIFVFIGLLLSLIADVLLMIEEVDLMIYGIVFFLLAHVSYIIGFTYNFSFEAWNIIPVILVFSVVGLLFKRI